MDHDWSIRRESGRGQDQLTSCRVRPSRTPLSPFLSISFHSFLLHQQRLSSTSSFPLCDGDSLALEIRKSRRKGKINDQRGGISLRTVRMKESESRGERTCMHRLYSKMVLVHEVIEGPTGPGNRITGFPDHLLKQRITNLTFAGRRREREKKKWIPSSSLFVLQKSFDLSFPALSSRYDTYDQHKSVLFAFTQMCN